MRALWSLEIAVMRHQIAEIRRSPLRLAAWVVYLLFIAWVGMQRLMASHAYTPLGFVASPRWFTAGAGAYLALLGLTALPAAHGAVAPFRNAAEPVLFSNSGIRSLTIVVWLQLRKTAAGWLRAFGSLIYGFVALTFAPMTGTTFARAFLAALLGFALLMSLQLPVWLLARGSRAGAVRALAWLVAAAGCVYGAAGVIGGPVRESIVTLTHVDPGRAVVALLSGSPIAWLVALTIFGVLIAVVAALGDDALPELFAAYQRSPRAKAEQGVQALRRAREAQAASRARRQMVSARRVPGGALSLVWKDWIVFRRVGGARIFWLVSCAFWATSGAGTTWLSRHYGDPFPLVLLLIALAVFLIFVGPLGASVALQGDFGKPLFWLSPVSLRARLATVTLAHAWRVGTALACAPLSVAVVSGEPLIAALSLPVGIATGWSLQALGVALYSVFPDPLDARGPVGVLRFVLTIAFFIPAIAVTAAAALLHASLATLALAFAATLACEGWSAIEVATLRLGAGGAALTSASRS